MQPSPKAASAAPRSPRPVGADHRPQAGTAARAGSPDGLDARRPAPAQVPGLPFLEVDTFGLSYCRGARGTRERRIAMAASVWNFCRQRLPPTPGQPLVLTDLEAGQLRQLARLVNGLLAGGYRALTLNIFNQHFPASLCGEHRFGRQGRVEAPPAAGAPPQRLTAAAPCSDAEGTCRRMGSRAEKALAEFLDGVEFTVTYSRADLAIEVNAFRGFERLAAGVAEQAIPRAHVVLGADLPAPTFCRPEDANCLVLGGPGDTFGVMRYRAQPPYTFALSSTRMLEDDSPRACYLRAMATSWNASPAFVEEICRHAAEVQPRWVDWPRLRFSEAIGALARQDARVIGLECDHLPNGVESYQGYDVALGHRTELIALAGGWGSRLGGSHLEPEVYGGSSSDEDWAEAPAHRLAVTPGAAGPHSGRRRGYRAPQGGSASPGSPARAPRSAPP